MTHKIVQNADGTYGIERLASGCVHGSFDTYGEALAAMCVSAAFNTYRPE